jgi:phosphatidylserine/phosphatidylglycerophosphate/cardiolipin synthase-like enzyme
MGDNPDADFTLNVRRGEGMVLLSMNWREGTPPGDFVGFAIAYLPPGAKKPKHLWNRLAFLNPDGTVNAESQPSDVAPIQKFRWVHFPPDADVDGEFNYTVAPIHMASDGTTAEGAGQTTAVTLGGDTYPNILNIAFTRGYLSSQAYVDTFMPPAPIPDLLPDESTGSKTDRLAFTPTHPKAAQAYDWLGFEARAAIEQVLDAAISDTAATVYVIAYDLDVPEIVDRLEQLGARLHVIVDDSAGHGKAGSPETAATARLVASAGVDHVRRGHMGGLQHNKTIVVDSATAPTVVCGSTNFSWRGIFVQSNNALILRGATAVQVFRAAFDNYGDHLDDAAGFESATTPPEWKPLGLTGLDAQVTFSPHSTQTSVLDSIAQDIRTNAKSSVFYSLAFLYESGGALRETIKDLTESGQLFIYGVSDKAVGGIDVQAPGADPAPVHPQELNAKDTPPPFRVEPAGGLGPTDGGGTRMHHKFVVIDFGTPDARVYAGSFNFSAAADNSNGENLLLIKDPRVATSYAIEALRIFDHYEFRLLQQNAATAQKDLCLQRPPASGSSDKTWWDRYYTDPRQVRDRVFFA